MTRRLALAAACASLVALAGCSSDDPAASDRSSDGPAVTSSTAPPSAAATAAPSSTAAAGPATEPGGQVSVAPDGTPAGTTADSQVPPAPTPPPGTQPPSTEPLGDPAVGVQTVATLSSPLDVAWRAGDPTMFVVEQEGRIVPVRGGSPGRPVLDITDRVGAGGERGLLGLTFSPDGRFAYVDYTDREGDTVVSELPVAEDGTMSADLERVLLQVDQPYGNHNGGNVTIGPDGYLYIGMGDGGSGGDPERRALDVSDLLGKILRIDPAPGDGDAYGIPADNPFVGVAGARPEIWSVGVRNPWRMSFDPATGDLWFGDVGQGDREEIDLARAADGGGRGANFGWSAFEGTQRFNEDQPADGATPPIYEYEHGDAGCSVSGGAVYRGSAIPALVGWYVFGDYCSGNIYGIRLDGGVVADSVLLTELPAVGAIRAAPDGELHAVSLAGDVALLVPA